MTEHQTFFKQPRVKSKKHTNLSNGLTCVICGADDAYACHYNGTFQHQYGKGRGVKGSDIATADFCYKCDQHHSEGVNIYSSIEERDQMFLHYIMLTIDRKHKLGFIKI